MIKSKFLAAQFFFAVLVCAGIVWAQYPDTLWVPVTFYDFRSNGTNPEFEMDHEGRLRQGQVASTLDAERKPALGTTPYLNYGVKNWFRKWDLLSAPIHAKGDSMKPGYDDNGVFLGFTKVNHDTFFKNIVIKDSLPFIHQGGGTYLFERDGQNNTPQFFWIDGKGFGNEGRIHNFSFTMEMHRAFVYKRGMQFQFNGDDDVWAFVDGRLAMDLGGLHGSLGNTFTIDNMGLVAGQEYSFDFFYAERHTNDANIKIITNFFDNSTATTVSISEIQLDALPSIDTISAGDSLKLTATVWLDSVNQFGAHLRLLDTIRSGAVQWYFDGDSSGGKYVSGQGPIRRNTFTATKAYKTFRLRAQIVENGQTITKIKSVYVRANIAHHLNVEGIAYGQAGFNVNLPANVTSLTMPNTTVRDTVYAVLRDIYNNYASSSASTAWVLLSADASIATAQPGNASIGEGILIKQGSAGSVQIAANNLDSASLWFRDTITVTVDPASYAELRFIAGTGGLRRVITTLTINRTRDTVLYAEARRADNVINPATGDAWWPIQTTWSLSVSPVIAVQNPAPSSGFSWTFHALDTGHTTMLIRYGASLTQTLPVVVSQGGADRIVLYNINAVQYSDPSITYSWQAGVVLPVTARIVDSYGLQLTQYSTAPQDANITWVVRQVLNGQLIDTGIGTLSAASGSVMNFIPKRAYTTLYVIASFNNTLLNRIDRDTIRISVNPPIVDHIVIEPTPDSTQSLNRDNPFPGNPHQIVMSNTGGALGVYGILRDRYGNFVNHADSVSWISRDTMVVTAVIGPSWQQGQGLITRQTSSNDTTWVVAAKGALTDSIMIIISAVTYDSLQIYVLDNGVKNIAALSIRTDQDTTFYARGKRSDNGQWANVPVSWWGTPALNFRPTAPTGPTWQHAKPDSIGTGRIIASCSGTTGTIADTVTVTVLPGLPSRLTLYPRDGAPTIVSGINPPRPDQSITDTIVAGRNDTLVAKLFDLNNKWLSAYENSAAPVIWNITELPGNTDAPTGALSVSRGYKTVFTALRAYNTVQVTATFVENGRTVTNTSRLYIKSDAAANLYIESSPQRTASPHVRNDLGLMSFSSTDSIKYAYAVLRDRFGNYVSSSTGTQWITLDSTVIKAAINNGDNGEGAISRASRSGSTRVVARNTLNPALFDTLPVMLSGISYSALRIVVRDTSQINNLMMRTDQDTIIRVLGQRSDNLQWEAVQAAWRMDPVLSTSQQAPQASDQWAVHPNDTGTGRIIVSLGNAVPDTLLIDFNVGLPAQLALYASEGMPGAGSKFPNASEGNTIIAGTPFFMVGKVFDRNGVWLSSYEAVATPIRWKTEEVSGSASTGMLRDSIYYRNSYTAQRAYTTVQVIAEYVAYGVPMRDTVTLTVVPGAARHVYIESDQNPPLNSANAVDTVRIPDNETYRSVYAVIRDSLGNLIGYSTQNSWHSFDTGAVYGENGNNTIGEGKLRRNPATVGDTVLFAMQCVYDGTTWYDTAAAVVLAYHFTQLRIIDGSGNPVNSLAVNTNDNTILRVQGLRSDVPVWIDVAAQWQTTPGLQISPRAPERAGSWTFSPDSAGSGYLWVTMGNDSVTAPDSIPVTFTRGALTSVEFILLTPTNQLIAGDTILAVVRIRNADGLVPGAFCFSGDNSNSVIYRDIDAAPGSSPVIIVDGVDTTLNPGTSSLVTMAQCFSQGLDTVRVVLFNAATNNSHKLSVVIGSLTASTSVFSLMPGMVDSMVIETGAGLHVTSRVLNYPNDYLSLYSVLYDASGNRRGNGKSNWRTTGTLHPIENANNTVRVYYSAAEVTGDESGLIIARVVDSSNGIHEDTVSVSIKGPRPVVTGAITRDMSGNGILDAIELRFSRVATIPHDYPFLDSMYSNFMDGTVLRIASITRYGGTLTTADTSLSDSVFLIHLIEGTALAQTAQTPYFDIKGLPGIIDTFLIVGDGAGPVITSVVLTINDAGPLRDMVTVTLSETIIGSDGSMFKQSTAPARVFDVWKMYTGTIDTVLASGETIHQNQIMSVDGALDGIAVFTAVSGTSLTFKMTNGYALSADFYLSLKVDSNGFAAVMDASDSANLPVLTNQKIKITQIGTRSDTGISTKRSRACGDCGTGVELAFFPAIGTGAFSFFRKRKVKKLLKKS